MEKCEYIKAEKDLFPVLSAPPYSRLFVFAQSVVYLISASSDSRPSRVIVANRFTRALNWCCRFLAFRWSVIQSETPWQLAGV